MNIEEIREYCLSLPMATEDFPFDDTTLVFRVMNKIFAILSLDGSSWFALKCDPEYALELREKYPGILPAYHMNKKYWNQVDIAEHMECGFMESLVRHSYSEVVKKFPAKTIREFPILKTVTDIRNSKSH